MKNVVRTAVAVAGMLLLAQGAMAEGGEGPNCEEQNSCGGGGGSEPELPCVPSVAVDKYATFFAYPSDGWNSNVVQGLSYYNNQAGQFYLAEFGHGAGTPFDDSVHTFGGGNSYSTVQAFFAPDPTVAATAHQDTYHGRSDAGVTLGYLVTLAAPDAATADAIQALMGSNPFATVQGTRTLTASGYGTSYGSGFSVYGPDGDSSYGSYAVCNDSSHLDGCGTGSFSFNLGFKRGNEFADGNANYFYAMIGLSVTAEAGLGGLGIYPGDASAFVDPTITLSSMLTGMFGNQLTLDVGGYGPPANAGAVPEPASWALLVVSFGVVGGTMRTQRRKVRFA